jgi:hypothetical protein
VQLKIYLSSTFEDLKDYRERVYRELRTLRHDVIAMEDYVAADVRPVDKCLADVRASDIYVGLFAWRYGYVPPKHNPQKLSVTDLELREAVKHKKPRLLFILKDTAMWPPARMDANTGDNERGDRITTLRRELREDLLAGGFESADELASKVVAALYRWQMDSTAPAAAAAAPQAAPGARARARKLHTNLWETGARLRVRFMDGAPPLRARVLRVARIWAAYANLTLEQSDDEDAELRVSFEGEGHYSYVGAQSLHIPTTQPTLVLGWVRETSAIDELENVVLHEFGHALGLLHEHNNPDGDIPWNKATVYRDLRGPPQQWSKETVDREIFSTWDRKLFPFTKPFDPHSVMTYSIPAGWTKKGFLTGRNVTLSQGDKEFIGRLYPYD